MAKNPVKRKVSVAIKKDGHVRLYEPTSSKPGVWRVVCRRSGETPIERTAGSKDEAIRIYDQLVMWDRAQLPLAPKRGAGSSHSDINALCIRTVAFLRSNGKSNRYVDKIEDTLRNHIQTIIGEVPVSEWASSDCTKVLDTGRNKGLSAATLQDIGASMRALITEARRSPRLLLPGDDPMNGVKYAVTSSSQGQSATYVPPNQRPPTEAIMEAAKWLDERGARLGRPWLGLPGRVMGFAGTRLGETLALRPCDIQGRRIHVHGTVEKRSRPGSTPVRKVPKNYKTRETVVGEELAGLLLARSIEVENEFGPEAPLFPATNGGWMSTGSFATLASRPVRAAGMWKKGWAWENHRHHCATWWHDQNIPIETISLMLGHHSVAFTYATYFRTNEKSLNQAQEILDGKQSL